MGFLDGFGAGYSVGSDFMQGRARSRERSALEEIGSMVANGDREGASRAAFQQGRLELGSQIAAMPDPERQRVMQSNAALGRALQALAPMDYEDRRRTLASPGFQASLQRVGIPAAAISAFDPTDANIAVISNQFRELEDILSGRREDRQLDQKDRSLGQQDRSLGIQQQNADTTTFNAGTGRINAGTQQDRLFLDQDRFAHERQAESAAPAQERDPVAIQTLNSAISNIDRLLPGGDLNNGFRASFGFRKGATGPFAIAGTDKASARALVDQIAGGLTLEQASALKGVLSDRDMALLEQSASRLSNRGISDPEAQRELEAIRSFFETKLREAGGALGPQAGAPATPTPTADPLGIR